MYSYNGRKLDILFVFGGEKAQGAEIVIERMMMKIADRYNLHLILSPGEFSDQLLSEGKPYKVTVLNDLKKLNRSGSSKTEFYKKALINYFNIPRAISRYIRDNDIDVVHANTLVPAAYMLPLVLSKTVTGSKVKWLWSDHDMAYFSKLENTLASFCLTAYNRTLIVSAALKRKYNHLPHKLVVFYNGLDTAIFKKDRQQRTDFRNRWGISDAQIVLAIAGSINPDKGQLQLIEIFTRLKQRYDNIKLVIAGNYAAQFPEFIVQMKDALALQPDALNIGFVANTVELYNGCDIIVNNSNNTRSESLGTTIYEAMACESIVVASRTGGTPEIITDHVEGFLFKPEDTADLEEKLNYVLNRFTELNAVRQAAREKVVRRFNIDTMAGDYQTILTNLIETN